MSHTRIAEGIYHVGDITSNNGLDCNPYLLIDGKEAVLFDPGSSLDFQQVLANVKELVPIEDITHIVLHHEDPDFCAAVPLFEELGIRPKIVTSWRTMTLVQYYGIQSPYYLLEENESRLTLSSGRVLQFIPTPYLHFAGAFATYDGATETLFSSDLFGAFSYNHTLYADDTYLEKMLTFHEHYMPSNSVLRPVMDVLLGYGIRRILPQHGSIIDREVETYIHALRTLQCGTLLDPIKKNLLSSGGYLMIFNDVVKRCEALYAREEVREVLDHVPELIADEAGGVGDYYGEPEAVWNSLFDTIKQQKGMLWITVLEPYVRGLVATYDIPVPTIMTAVIESSEMENRRLREKTKSLEQTIQSVNERLIKCSVTGLFNEVFFKSLLIQELETEDWRDVGAFACIGIDNFSNYQLKYGREDTDSALSNMAYLLKETFGNHGVFKLDSTDFGVYLKGLDRQAVITGMEQVRVAIARSTIFLGRLTVSIGIAFPEELQYDAASFDQTVLRYLDLGLTRLRKAKVMGKNCVCFEGEGELEKIALSSVLLVDSDPTNIEIIRAFLSEIGAEVFSAQDGYEALLLAEKHVPAVIVSEVNLPKMDGFLLREAVLEQTATKGVETIFLSYQKDEDSVSRAVGLGISHYIKKPYMMSELIGIIKRSLKGTSL